MNEELIECKFCDEELEESELYNTNYGLLCDTCIKSLRSRGENIEIYY